MNYLHLEKAAALCGVTTGRVREWIELGKGSDQSGFARVERSTKGEWLDESYEVDRVWLLEMAAHGTETRSSRGLATRTLGIRPR